VWDLLPRQLRLTVIVVLTIYLTWAITSVTAWWSGTPVSPTHLTSLITTLIGVVTVAAAGAAWRHVWRRVPWLSRHVFPDCNGTWCGHLVSTWIDPKTGQSPPPIRVSIWIRQTLFATSVKMRTGESGSYSTHCWLQADQDAGRFKVNYVYTNEPTAVVQDRSTQHDGTCSLELDLDLDPERLTGIYYTARKTSGDMELNRVSKTVEEPPLLDRSGSSGR
jgi:hypothetical protein